MENQVQFFNNPKFGTIRTVLLDDVPHFVGKDVTDSLGYVNSRDALAKHVDPEDKKDGVAIRDAIGRLQPMTVINESGLFSLILSSKLPQAKEFKHWGTSEVLPAIRKYGSYSLNKIDYKEIVADPEFLIQIGQALKAEKEKVAQLTTENAVLAQQVAELQPKATYCDLILQCKSLVSISKIAKDYGMSAMKMNKLLHELKVQYNQGGIWLLYQNYAELGWTSTKTYNYINREGEHAANIVTYWTPKGRLGLYQLLKENGYIPNIEK